MNRPIADIVADIRAYMKAEKLTQKSLGAATGVHQSQISRILQGDCRKVGKNLNKICKYANIETSIPDSPPEQSTALMAALRDTWNGSEQHAKQLAQLIRKVGPILYK